MRNAKLVYIKDLGLLFCHEDHSNLLDIIQEDVFVIICNGLAAELEDLEVEIKAMGIHNELPLHMTHSGKVKTVIWDQ